MDLRILTMEAQWAENAITPIPSPPTPGHSYRDTELRKEDIIKGQSYSAILDSAKLNQLFYKVTGLIKQGEQYGVLPFSLLTNYPKFALCLGLNGTLYQALQESGPDTVAGSKPTDNTEYWTVYQSTAGIDDEIVEILEGLAKLQLDLASVQTNVGTLQTTVTAIQTSVSGKLSIPVTSDIQGLSGGTGAAVSLPSGGTWAYFVFRIQQSTGAIEGSKNAGVAAGGSIIGTAYSGFYWFGFAWKVT